MYLLILGDKLSPQSSNIVTSVHFFFSPLFSSLSNRSSSPFFLSIFLLCSTSFFSLFSSSLSRPPPSRHPPSATVTPPAFRHCHAATRRLHASTVVRRLHASTVVPRHSHFQTTIAPPDSHNTTGSGIDSSVQILLCDKNVLVFQIWLIHCTMATNWAELASLLQEALAIS